MLLRHSMCWYRVLPRAVVVNNPWYRSSLMIQRPKTWSQHRLGLASLGRCIVMRNMASTCLHSDVLLLTHFENVTRTLVSGVEDSTRVRSVPLKRIYEKPCGSEKRNVRTQVTLGGKCSQDPNPDMARVACLGRFLRLQAGLLASRHQA